MRIINFTVAFVLALFINSSVDSLQSGITRIANTRQISNVRSTALLSSSEGRSWVAVVGVELREVVVVVAGDQVDVEEDVVAAEAEAEVVVDQEWTTELN